MSTMREIDDELKILSNNRYQQLQKSIVNLPSEQTQPMLGSSCIGDVSKLSSIKSEMLLSIGLPC